MKELFAEGEAGQGSQKGISPQHWQSRKLSAPLDFSSGGESWYWSLQECSPLVGGVGVSAERQKTGREVGTNAPALLTLLPSDLPRPIGSASQKVSQ